MPSYALTANVPLLIPGTTGGGEFTLTNLSPVSVDGRDLYVSDSANVDPRKALATIAPGASTLIAAAKTLYAWSATASRVGVEGRPVNAADLNARYVLGAPPYLLNADHLRAKLGPKIPMLMGTPGGSGRGGITILADGDSYMEAYGSANDGGDASAYGSTSWVHILGELIARKLNPAEVAPNRKGTYRRPLASAVGGRNPFGLTGSLLTGWNRSGGAANWNGTTVPIPAGSATLQIAEPRTPAGADAPLRVLGGAERVLPVAGVALESDGTSGGQCLVYRLEASVTHVEVVYVRPPGTIGNQSITVDVFAGSVAAYPKGGGDLATCTFPLVWAGNNAAPIVAIQPVGVGANPSVAAPLPANGPKTVVVHVGTGGPFAGYSLGFGLLAYAGNYDRGVRLVNLGVSGATTNQIVPSSLPTAFTGVACPGYSPLSAGFYDAAGANSAKGFGNLGLHLVGFGINDATAMSVAQFAANLNAIVDKDQSLPSAPATLFVWYPTGVFSDADRSAYREAMQNVAKARGVAMLDFGSALSDPAHAPAIAAGYVAAEGSHPSDLLHSTMGYLGAQAILGALGIAL